MSLDLKQFEMYNTILIAVALVILFLAYRKGLVRQLTDVITYVVSFLIAGFVSPILAQTLAIVRMDSSNPVLALLDSVAMRMINIFVWFVIVFIGLRIIYRILILIFHKKKKTKLSFVNHMLGLALGAVKVFLLGMTLSLLLQFPLIRYGDVFVRNSVLQYLDAPIKAVIHYWEG